MKTTLFKSYSNTFVFDTLQPGPTISIFGGIHGDEIVGVQVVDKLVQELESGDIKIKKGKLILAYGNEIGIKLGKRGGNYNLNRIFKNEYINKESNDLEINRVKELSDILNNSDILFDIHSVSSKSVPFLFSENIEKELLIASNLGLDKIIVGWGEIGGDLLSGDTDSYMHSLGKTAFTIECGNHTSNEAFSIGYNSTIKLLEYFNLLDNKVCNKKEPSSIFIKMYKIKTTKTGTFKFKKGIDNFSEINKGDFIGLDGEEKVFAEEDFIILLPTYADLSVGEEVFYYGKKIN